MKKVILTFLFFYSFISIQAQCSVDFGSAAGDFTFAYVSGSDIVNGASSGANAMSTQSFDIWNEGAAPLDCSAGGGTADDITFAFEIVHAFDANTPGDGIIDTYAGSTHDITQSTSGLRGTTPLGNSGANETSTGDVRGYKITVSFANHINVTADEITVNTTSVNTRGKAFESCAVIFLDETGTPYGTATYEGFYGSGSAGAPSDPTCSSNNPAPGVAWTTTGAGVYTMQSSNTVMQDPANLCDIIGDTNGTDDNKDVAAVADAGLIATDRVGGFTFIVYLEDVASSTGSGANTTTSTSFTSTVNGFTISAPLPVELTSFDADIFDESVLLNWNTASEINNDHFDIEHSFNGIDFVKIGEVEGNGQSNSSNDYRFIDAQPKDGVNYYRLKQVDFDGKYEYSKIVFVEYKKEEKVKIFPTLCTSEINITLPENGNNITYKILNLTGQVLQEGNFDNTNDSTNKIDIQNFPNGNYFIQIGNKSFSETLRFNKI